MLLPACAVEDVDVGRLLVGMRLARLNLVVLGMPTARLDHLVLLQMINVVLFQMPLGQIGHLDARTSLDLRFRQDRALGP